MTATDKDELIAILYRFNEGKTIDQISCLPQKAKIMKKTNFSFFSRTAQNTTQKKNLNLSKIHIVLISSYTCNNYINLVNCNAYAEPMLSISFVGCSVCQKYCFLLYLTKYYKTQNLIRIKLQIFPFPMYQQTRNDNRSLTSSSLSSFMVLSFFFFLFLVDNLQ